MKLVLWWERLAVPKQIAIALPALSAALFLLNITVFGQPAWRSVLYGLFEGGVVTALLLVATASERSKRPPPG